MDLPVRHVIGECTNAMQHCVVCGKLILDNRGGATEDGGPPPSWPTGDIYIVGKNPTVMFTTEPEEGFTNCTPE